MHAYDASPFPWYLATTLEERRDCSDAPLARRAVPQTLSEQLERWRAWAPFTSDDVYERWLTQWDLTQEELSELLSESREQVASRFSETPQWVAVVAEALFTADGVATPEDYSQDSSVVSIVAPFLKVARHRLEACLQAHEPSIQEHALTPDLLLSTLPQRLSTLAARAVVLELHIARLKGNLEGNTSEERFSNFIAHLSSPVGLRYLLTEYPVLSRLLSVAVEASVDAAAEFARRFVGDWTGICERFFQGKHPGALDEVRVGAGDLHEGGRSVALLSFSSGERLVYKPRSLASESHFQQLLEWINQHLSELPFRTVRVWDRGKYGWMEHIAAEPCPSPEAAARFFRRQGGLLALLYALRAHDFHFENVIAAGEHPVLVDLESLFLPPRDWAFSEPPNAAYRTLSESVMMVGFLPARIQLKPGGHRVDLSGLSDTDGQYSPLEILQAQGVGTDEIRYVRERIPLPTAHNRIILNGRPLAVEDYAPALKDGFDQVYRLLLREREELLAEGGAVRRFENDRVRIVMRATAFYNRILGDMTHPDILTEGTHLDHLLGWLITSQGTLPSYRHIISAEYEALLRLDVPSFYTTPRSTNLHSSPTNVATGLFKSSGYEAVVDRLRGFSEADLARQQWIIEASLAARVIGEGRRTWPRPELPTTPLHPSRDELIEEAERVGQRLEEVAVHDGERVNWLGLTLSDDEAWMLTPVGADVYSGLYGIALFLSYLSDATGEVQYRRLSERALYTAADQVDELGNRMKALGAFSGMGGHIYTLTHIAALSERSDLLDRAERTAARVPALLSEDEAFDVVGGAAGCLHALLSLYACRPSRTVAMAAVECGHHLVRHAHPLETGVGWFSTITGKPIAGFSHGNTGIASALLRLYTISKDSRHLKCALDAFEYERTLFSGQAQNWYDIRDDVPPRDLRGNGDVSKTTQGARRVDEPGLADERFMMAWCHGAPGIGLGRLLVRSVLRNMVTDEVNTIEEEIAVALQTTQRAGFGGNHSLCHGDLGNLDTLLVAQRELGFSEQRQAFISHIVSRVFAGIRQEGWLCGVPFGTETPGLMTGIAGIGYGLLRAAAPDQIPSLLGLEPPYRCS